MNRGSEVVDKKKLVYGIGIIILANLVTIEMPYSDKSISQLMIPTIRFDNGLFGISALIVLALVIYGAHLVVESGEFKNKLVVVLVSLLIISPIAENISDDLLSPIYLMNDGVKTLRIKDSDLNIHIDNEKAKLEFSAIIRSYRDIDSDVKIYLRLPEMLKEMVVESEILVYESSQLYPRDDWNIETSMDIELNNGFTYLDLFDVEYYFENYTLILVDEDQVLEIEMNDFW